MPVETALIDAPGLAALGALSDAHRVHLIESLAHAPAGMSSLASDLPITRQGTAKHLAVLETAGLVRSERVGRERVYSVDAAGLRRTAAALNAATERWSAQLDLIKEAAEAPEPR